MARRRVSAATAITASTLAIEGDRMPQAQARLRRILPDHDQDD